jgi:putative spermidine/putrescine transport system ATP-binding protein
MATLHVQFAGVAKSYDGSAYAVRDLDLDIARGEFVTLLGPSGSGKTTSLMMLAGFEEPSAGRILLDGRRIDHMPAHRRGIGVVFQNYALFPHMTVAGNLAFPLEVRGMARPEREAAVKRLVERVRLQGLEERYPAQLSGGQQQRVAVARALVFNPELVLMDEPLGALDKQLRENLQYEIKEIHRTFGVTIVYVTHDQSEALTMSDRIALFRDGRLEQVADPQTIYDLPATAFAARFIGETNMLAGTIAGADGADAVTVNIGGRPFRATRGNVEGKAGEAALLCVRPEHLSLHADGETRDNSLPATVREAIFHGDHVRLHLDAGGALLTTRVGAGLAQQMPPGTQVTVTLDARYCRALKPDAGVAATGAASEAQTDYSTIFQ